MSNKTLRETLPPMPKDCIYAFSSGLPMAVMSAYYSGDQMREYAVAARRQVAEECAEAFAAEVESWSEMRKAGLLGAIKRKGVAAIKARYGLDARGAKG